MIRTHTDIRQGERLDISVEFISRRAVDCEEGRAHLLTVADQTGEQFRVFAPEETTLCTLEAGEEYRFAGLLGAEAVASNDRPESACPDCGGRLRRGHVVDTAAVAVRQAVMQVEPESPFGVWDEDTALDRDDSAGRVDDWQPMTRGESVDTPEYVCRDCGRHVDRTVRDDVGEVVMNNIDSGMTTQETVGLAAGGAKGAGNFRENVEAGYTPRPAAISHEGVFYDYQFETGTRAGETGALFAPRYATAVSDHPLTGETERYLSVGLDSTLAVSEFERPPLDLVAVLDVSGSMDSPFDGYYYDEHGRRHETGDTTTTKMEAATQSLCALTEHLRDEDRLGVVLFNNRAHVAKPLREVGRTDMPAIRRHIQNVAAGGGTNLADGFDAAVDLLAGGPDRSGVERRAVFMTDMMPNTGATGESELVELFSDAAVDGIHTTFVGMGLDANADLAEALSGIRGGNHYFVNSPAEFERRLDDEFAYMVTPLVYDLTLELTGDGETVEQVYGSPTDCGDDRLVHVGTLFPSAKEDGESRGGVVLAKLAATEPPTDLELVASWTERNGGEHTERVNVELPDETGSFDHDGVRKAVALARYTDTLQDWARDVHERAEAATGVDDWAFPDTRGRHEQESVPLVVPDRHAERFATLRAFLRGEQTAVGDETLTRELDLLERLCEEAPRTPQELS